MIFGNSHPPRIGDTHSPSRRNSSGHCNGGPNPGTFWPARAIQLASRAQAKLGPGFPADKY
ncbi:MAG: hypothetical protein ACXVVQ_05420 [Solirubrobacteraceae bacterium]